MTSGLDEPFERATLSPSQPRVRLVNVFLLFRFSIRRTQMPQQRAGFNSGQEAISSSIRTRSQGAMKFGSRKQHPRSATTTASPACGSGFHRRL